MRVLMFSQVEVDQIWLLLAAFLHLGNLAFKESLENGMDTSHIDANCTQHIHYASLLLEVPTEQLKSALTTKRIIVGEECVSAPLSAQIACTLRDALVKTVYSQLFVWILRKINSAIYKPPASQTQSAKNAAHGSPKRPHSPFSESAIPTVNSTRLSTWNEWTFPSSNNTRPNHLEVGLPVRRSSVGVLDIFGFEKFDRNSFEQLCINFANENLQQFFVQHIFKQEQEEYLSEGINWNHIDYVDNQNTLDLISLRPMNILALIDEESQFPQGTDNSLLDKLIVHHEKHPQFVRPCSNAEKRFGIQHFAGVVYYDVDGILDKSRDNFSSHLALLIKVSTNNFLKELFQDSLTTVSKPAFPVS
ncbi:unnamed protein product [Dicrocoelium dendriticum]|nr:unnamed protein product [Dicrocoelium dendriticum]